MINFNHQNFQSLSDDVRDGLMVLYDVLAMILKSQWKKALLMAKKKIFIRGFHFDKITPNRVKQMYEKISLKSYQTKKNKQNWYENQLRVFGWLLITYSNAISLQPQQFEQQQWRLFSVMFYGKSIYLCKFQYLNLKKDHDDKSKKWSTQQEQLLNEILKQITDRSKWNMVAKQLYIRSQQKYFRTPRNCRQRWFNYLNPNKQKSAWSKQEDYNLIQIINQKGKKWALISKILFLNKRTQHTIKNRYNSLVLRYFKFINQPRKEDELNFLDLLQWIKNRPYQNLEETIINQSKIQQALSTQQIKQINDRKKIQEQAFYYQHPKSLQSESMIAVSPIRQNGLNEILSLPPLNLNWTTENLLNFQILIQKNNDLFRFQNDCL